MTFYVCPGYLFALRPPLSVILGTEKNVTRVVEKGYNASFEDSPIGVVEVFVITSARICEWC